MAAAVVKSIIMKIDSTATCVDHFSKWLRTFSISLIPPPPAPVLPYRREDRGEKVIDWQSDQCKDFSRVLMLLVCSKLPQFLKNLLSRQFLGLQLGGIFFVDRNKEFSPSGYFLGRERNILHPLTLCCRLGLRVKLIPFLACKIERPVPCP